MANFFGSLLTNIGGEMKAKEDKEAENAQWEKRQKLMNELEIEKDAKLAKNKRKDGNVYKDASGKWVTEILDGNGIVIGTRASTPSEVIAEENTATVAEGNKYQTATAKKRLDTFDEDYNLDRQAKQLQMESTRQGMAQSRERMSLDRQAAGGPKAERALQKEGEDVLYAISTLPGAESERDPEIIKLYRELEITMRLAREGAPGARAKLQVLKGKIDGLKARSKAGESDNGNSGLVNIPQGFK